MSSGSASAFDARIHLAAFDRVRRLTARYGLINRQRLAEGFMVDDQRWLLLNPQRGINADANCSTVMAQR